MDQYTEPQFESAALLTIDMQCDLLDGEPFCIPGTSAVLPTIHRLVAGFRASGRPVVHLVRLYDPESEDVDRCRRADVASGAGMLRPGTGGSQLAPGLAHPDTMLDAATLLAGRPQDVGPREWIMYKPRWGAFYRTALHDLLSTHGVTTTVVAGCNFPNCPRTTVYEASERDYRVVMVSDAVSGISPTGGDELTAIGVALFTADQVVGAL
jgi:nicotinamidase-related amidase